MTSILVRTFLLIIFLQLTACASLIVGDVAQGGNPAYQHDAQISSAVKSRLSADHSIDASSISVSAYQGTVTLRGNVATSRDVQRAIQLARGVQGVKQVISKLSVSSE